MTKLIKSLPSDYDRVFLFSYFKGRGDGLHLAWSTDGFSWNALNNDQPLITGDMGEERIMRDPFLLPVNDGFHLVWTAGWRGKGIGYAFSHDLVTWSPQQFLPVMEHEPKALNCWAPEIFRHDGGNFFIHWATTIQGRFPETDGQGDEGLDHRMYFTATPDFRSFSATKLFFDGGFNVIDATLVRDGDRYLLFMKDERPDQKNIRMAIGEAIPGVFRNVSPPLTGSYWAEGPSAIRIDNRWVVYFDKYKAGSIGAIASRDLQTWEDISDEVHFPSGAQHGSVVEIPFGRVNHLL